MTSVGSTPTPARSPLPYRLQIEQRLEVPRWLPLATTIGAVMAAFVIAGIIIVIAGGDPLRTFIHIAESSFGSPGVISDTLVKATPLMLTGLACALAFRMRLWNIGAEGQFLMGAWGASAVVLIPIVPPGTSWFITVPLMMVAGFAAGAAWGFVPGFLKARFGVNEIIVSLLMVYIAVPFIRYWVFGPWSEGGFQLSAVFPKEAWLPRLTDFAKDFPFLSGLTVHLGVIFGLVAASFLWFILKRSRLGYEIRLTGDNPRAARYAGVNIGRNTVLVFMLSGGLAGLAGMAEVTGVVHRLQDAISPGYGFTAIIIAYLAKFNPWGVVVASALFGALILAGREIQPAGIPAMIQGVILFALIASDVLIRYRVRLVRR